MAASIHDVLEYGPVVFSEAETDTLITINGSYLNWWAGDYSGSYECTDCRALGREDGLYGLDITQAMSQAQDYYNNVLAEEVMK
jgi:hypothetical protein